MMKVITKAMTLMNFEDSYDVSLRNQLFQDELDWVFFKSGFRPSEALFISYAYKGGDYPAYFNEVSTVFAQAEIMLTDITSGNPAVQIANAKTIVFGGGDYTVLINKMNSLITPTFNPYLAIKNRLETGIPYIGWNEGSSIISPTYFTPPASAIQNSINGCPFQIICNYLDSPQNRASIFDFLVDRPAIKKVITQEIDQARPDGSSVRLEESGAGMIDSATAPFPTVIRFKIVNGILVAS
jgi:hypothetical protein